MKKIISILLLITFINISPIMHLNSIKKDYANDYEKFEYYKEQLMKYYESGEFDNEVEQICKKALKYLLSLPKLENTIIFDIDETALSHYPLFKEKKFIWSLDNDIIPYRQKAICPAIKPILQFYKSLISNNYKVIFLTSRRYSVYEATYKNLLKEGFTQFEELILIPMDLFDSGIKHEVWKANVRKELSKRYNIVASISDNQKDFEGGNTGYCIKIPNYFY